LKAKFKKVDTAVQRRDDAITDILSSLMYLQRLLDNHPEVFHSSAKTSLQEMSRAILSFSFALGQTNHPYQHGDKP
jgi:predicted translin family RNA/ssDNA-binding protein